MVLLVGLGLLLRILLVGVAGGRLIVVVGVGVVGWIGGLLGLGGEVGWGLGLLAHDELGGHGGVDVLVELEADAAAAGADEELDGDLALCLGAVVEVDDAVHAFGDLALQHRLPGKARVEIHDVRLQSFVVERALDPADEIPRHLLKQKDLHVGNVSAKAAGQVELVAVRWRAAVRTGAPAPVRVLTVAVEARRRPRAPAPVAAKVPIPRKGAVSAAARFVPAWRGRPSRSVVVSPPAALGRIVESVIAVAAPLASAVRGPISVVLLLLGARNLEVC